MSDTTSRAARPTLRLAAVSLLAGTALCVGTWQASAQQAANASPTSVTIDLGEVADNVFANVMLAFVRIGLFSLRTVVDLRYETLEVSPRSGGLLITGVTMNIPVPGLEPRACEVTIGGVEYATSPLAFATGVLGSNQIEVSDVNVPLSCFPDDPDMQAFKQFMETAQLEEIAVDTLSINSVYDIASARAEIGIRLSAPNLADIDAQGEFDYLALRVDNEYGGDPLPVIEFGAIDLSIIDRGIVERARPVIAQFGVDLDQVPAIAGGGVTGALGLPDLGQNVQTEVQRFLTDGGRIALALRPGELWLDQLATLPPPEIVQAFNPTIGSGTRPPTLSAELLEAAANPAALSGEQAIEVANAYLSGQGLPRNPARAFEALQGGLDSNSAAQLLGARALLEAGTNIEDAYALAIRAGAGGERVGALLRRIERELTPVRTAAVQQAQLSGWSGENASATQQAYEGAVSSGDTAAILRLARQFDSGIGAPRNVGEAMLLALLADAGGEVGASSIVRQIEGMADRTPDARAAWAPVIANARDRATRVWLDQGLGARVASQAN